MRPAVLVLVAALAACDPDPLPRSGARSGTRGDPFGRRAPALAGTAALGYKGAHALVVGVSRYASPSLGSLEGTVFDAEEVAALLSSRYGMKTTLLVDREVPVTRARLLGALAALKKDVGRDDALLFFYAGHGIPGRLVPADAEPARDPAAWKNLVSFAELGAALRACDAHHTLVVLDSCFSGSALAEGSALREGVGVLGDPSLRIAEGDNFTRVFNRRSFQVLTAGTGQEEVDDLAKISRLYAGMKDLEKHSPFTGVLLQALRGLTGRSDGRVSASDLGYYVKDTLVNENAALQARQKPLFGALGGGDGDFLFLPVQRVLNPRLVAPLYLPGAEYAELRTSAGAALAAFVAEAEAKDREDLARGAAPHLLRLLRDAQTGPRKAAARAVARLAPLSADFARCVPVLAERLGEEVADEEKDLAAAALGALAAFADEKAVEAMTAYGLRHRARFYARVAEEKLAGRPWPQEFYDRYGAVGQAELKAGEPAPARMRVLEKVRAVDAWALTDGNELLRRLDRRHQEGRALLEKAEKAAAEKKIFDARRGIEAAAPLLWPRSEEWTRGQELRRTSPDLRPLWRVAPPALHEGAILRTAASGDGRRLATWGEDGAVRWWNAATGALEGELPAVAHRMAGMALSDDGRLLIWATEAGELLRWDLERKEKVAEAQMLRGIKSFVALDGAASRAAVGMFEGVIGLLDPAEPEKAVYLRDAGAAVMLLARHRASGTLVSYGGDHRLRLWDLAAGKLRAEIPAMPEGEEDVETLVVLEEQAEAVWTCRKGAVCAAPLAGEPAARVLARFKSPAYASAAGGDVLVLAMADLGVTALRFPDLEPLWLNASIVPGEAGYWRRMSARSDLLLRNPPLAFSADGATLRVSRGAELAVLDAKTGLERAGLIRGRIVHAAFTPDGRRLLSAGSRLIFWDGKQPRAIDHEGQAGVAAWMYPDGLRVLAVFERQLLCLDAGSEAVRWKLPLEPGAQIRLSRDGRDVVAAEGKRLRVLDADTGAPRREWTRAMDIWALALHPEGRLAAVASADATRPSAVLLDLADGREIWSRSAGTLVLGGTSALAFDPDGLLLAVGDEQGRVSVWRVRTGEAVPDLGATDLESVRDLAFSPDGRLLAVAGSDVRIWDLKEKKERLRFSPSIRGTLSVAFGPDARSILAVGLDGALSLWSLGLDPESWRLPRPPSGTAELSVSPAGDRYAASGMKALSLCSTRTGELLASVPAESPDDMVFSRDGLRLAAVEEGRFRVYETGTLRKLAEFPAKHGALSPDGAKVVVLQAHVGKVLDLDGKPLGSFQGLQGAALSRAAFVLDGAVLSGDDTGEVRLWMPGESQARQVLPASGNGIFHLSATLDGRRAVACGLHSPAYFFDFAARTSVQVGPSRRDSLSHVSLSPDGRSLLFAWSDGAVCIWDLERNAERLWIWLDDFLPKPSWHPDGRRLYTAHVRRHGIRVLELDRLAAPLPATPAAPSVELASEFGESLSDPLLRYADLDAAFLMKDAAEAPLQRFLERRLEEAGLELLRAGLVDAARRRFAQAKSTAHEASFAALQAVKEGRWTEAAPLLEKADGLDQDRRFLLRVAAARRLKDVEGEKALRASYEPKRGPLLDLVRFARGEGTAKDVLADNRGAELEGELRVWLSLLGEPGHAEEARKLLKAASFEVELLRP